MAAARLRSFVPRPRARPPPPPAPVGGGAAAAAAAAALLALGAGGLALAASRRSRWAEDAAAAVERFLTEPDAELLAAALPPLEGLDDARRPAGTLVLAFEGLLADTAYDAKRGAGAARPAPGVEDLLLAAAEARVELCVWSVGHSAGSVEAALLRVVRGAVAARDADRFAALHAAARAAGADDDAVVGYYARHVVGLAAVLGRESCRRLPGGALDRDVALVVGGRERADVVSVVAAPPGAAGGGGGGGGGGGSGGGEGDDGIATLELPRFVAPAAGAGAGARGAEGPAPGEEESPDTPPLRALARRLIEFARARAAAAGGGGSDEPPDAPAAAAGGAAPARAATAPAAAAAADSRPPPAPAPRLRDFLCLNAGRGGGERERRGGRRDERVV